MTAETDAVTPLATSIPLAPSVSVPAPLRVGVPSLNRICSTTCVLTTLTVYAPVASEPAEKMATLPSVHPLRFPLPSAKSFQKLSEPHVPLGVVPAPTAAPLP